MARSKDGGTGPEATLAASLLDAAARAAGMLEAAWAVPEAEGLRAEVVGGLTRSLKAEIEALARSLEEPPADGVLTDGAARAADLANLAASSLPDLPEAAAPAAAAATHLAAGAAQALCALAVLSPANPDDDTQLYSRKDVRSARWRARFAIRQADEFGEIED